MPLTLTTNNDKTINYIVITPNNEIMTSGVLRIGDYTTTGSMLSITSSGNVGIGTTEPTYTLDVNGDINLTGKLYKNGTEFQFGTLPETFNSFQVSSGTMVATTYTGGNMNLGQNITANSIYISGLSPALKVNNFIVLSSGNVGVGTLSPSFNLELLTDSAAKPSTNTWTISSDERLKINITSANLETCYNTVKNIPLKRYTWRHDIYNDMQVIDRNKLGWIAQDVETIFPKAIRTVSQYDIPDCKTLDIDQIVASMYGCLQKLITVNTEMWNEVQNIKNNL